MGYVHNRITEPERGQLRDQAVRLYVERGMSLREVAERIGRADWTVRVLLTEAGVRRRPAWRRPKAHSPM